ncbi:RNA binding protein, putative [Penicillium digitatum]|uniref:RNA binding protein, putative n=1 Tax=Penicillium digitatum TaxID=36651 RepID=A0A7T6XGZ9_PENDI|nr:RNA binding protein, putative [Penicillium digitatum]
MLKPFQVRNLRVSTHQEPEQLADPRAPPGVVQISATDYDELASNHPRARLTYMDVDDDDETITVGSALELSQRLDEPLDTNTQLESVEPSPDDISPMHVFDIHRSNSVTELWKRFEHNVPKQDLAEQHEVPVHITTSPSVSADQPQPLMEAFEAELAKMFNAADSLESPAPLLPNSAPTIESSVNVNSGRSPHPVEILATQVLDQLIHGATMLQSEWRTKIPGLQRQLQNAQRQFENAQKSLPENVEASLRALLITVEAHLRTAFYNLPDGGRQMAEDAFQAGRPVAETAADGLRMMASELNEVGKTLFAAFESEFGRAVSTASTSNSTSEVPNPGASGPSFNIAAYNEATASGTTCSQNSNANPSRTATNEKSTAGLGESSPPDAAQAGVPPNPSRHGQPTPVQSNHWAPPSWPAPSWNPFQTYHAPPPPCPSLPPALLPNFTYWPQGPPAFASRPPPVFNAPSKTTHTSQTKSGEWKNKPATKSLFIGNVGFKVTDKMIQDVFAAKGFLVKVDLPLETASGRHAGFGYVHFPSEYPAFAAMDALQGAVIDGHSINLEPMYHPPIESTNGPRTKTSITNNAPSERNSTISGPFSSPFPDRLQKSPCKPRKTENRRKSVNFVELTQNVDLGQAQTESSALLDSPSDDPAFSARFPSLLPETSAHHIDPLSDRGVSSYSHTESHFPPVSQWEAQVLANRQERPVTEPTASDTKHPEGPSTHALPLHPTRKAFGQSQPASHLDAAANKSSVVDAGQPSDFSKAIRDPLVYSFGVEETMRPVVDLNGPQTATKLKRRATEHKPHNPNHWHASETDSHHPLNHSASMRHPGDRSHGPAGTDAWARLSRRERKSASSRVQIPGSFPVENTTRVELSSTRGTSVPESDDTAVERCVSALVDMGYGAEQEGGRSRMAVYAAMANGDLMDAIDMIEEERSIYDRRPSQ